jgi:hypothetical protein
MMKTLWNCQLTIAQRRRLLHAAHDKRNAFMIRMEVAMYWDELLPSTQALLRGLDWTAILE